MPLDLTTCGSHDWVGLCQGVVGCLAQAYVTAGESDSLARILSNSLGRGMSLCIACLLTNTLKGMANISGGLCVDLAV